MATTPKWKIQLFDDTFPVSPLENLLNMVANTVEAALTRAIPKDTGWLPITLSSGFEPANAERRPEVRRIGDVVYARGSISRSNGSNFATSATTANIASGGGVPATCRPDDVNFAVPALGTSGAATGQWRFGTNGSLDLRSGSGTSSYYTLTGVSYSVGE